MSITGNQQSLQSQLTDLQLFYDCPLSNCEPDEGLLLLVLFEAFGASFGEEAECLHVSPGDVDAPLWLFEGLAANVLSQFVDDDPAVDFVLVHVVRGEEQAGGLQLLVVQGFQDVLEEVGGDVDVDVLLLVQGLELPGSPVVQRKSGLLEQGLPKGVSKVEVVSVELQEQLLVVVEVQFEVQIDERGEEIIEIINDHYLNCL